MELDGVTTFSMAINCTSRAINITESDQNSWHHLEQSDHHNHTPGHTMNSAHTTHRMMSEKYPRINQLTAKLMVTENDLHKMMDQLMDNFIRGLNKETHKSAVIKMFPTFVRSVPSGKESGSFLALDLGGTNFRILWIKMQLNSVNMESRSFPISKVIMEGTKDMLFDHIAKCLLQFLNDYNLMDIDVALGFTFSFPCVQEDLAHARLVRWTKGFKVSGVEGQDVGALLKEALDKIKLTKVHIAAIVNDTTGTLMSCAFKTENCGIGVIIGTGTNACYMEKLENVGTWDKPVDDPKQVIINTEWGAFGDDGALDYMRCDYDRTIDEGSINKGTQLFEKMCSGFYLGEIARMCIIECYKDGSLFEGKQLSSTNFMVKWSIPTKFLSLTESDVFGEVDVTRKAIQFHGVPDPTDDDCKKVQIICSRVSTRSARLVAGAICTIIKKMGRPYVAVGIDGTVYKKHPHYSRRLNEHMTMLLKNTGFKFQLVLSDDGSGKGAAVIAAVSVKKMAQKE